jgi:hypothetical protein
MFVEGDLVMIIRSDGMGIVEGAPPALVLRSYLGRPSHLLNTPDNMRDRTFVYDILFMGKIERSIDGEWLKQVSVFRRR